MPGRVHLLEPHAVDALARRAAGWLAARGVARGDRVAVLTANHPRLLALTHGALRSGIVPVLISPYLAEEERARQIADSEASLVVSSPDEVPWEDAPARELADVPLARPMLYTSGTTGYPKGVWTGVLDEAAARAYADDEAELWRPERDALALVLSPLHHSAPHRSATAALLAGASVLLLDSFDARTAVELLAGHRISSTFLVPTHLRRMFALGDVPRPRDVVRVLHAGEPCPESLKRTALDWFPAGALWEFYGSTEGQFSAISPDEWLERPGSVGRARSGRALEIADPGEDGVGTVFVRAPAFARWEYWRAPEQTARAWRDDAFTVGDLGHLDEEGYLWLVSRREDLILTGGVNVYPAMVERILLEHPDVVEAVVFGIPDEEWGERVCAAVVGAREEDVRVWLDGRLEGPHLPKQLVQVDALPRTTTGKVNRRALRAMLTEDAP